MKKLTREIFIERSSIVHNSNYDYSLVEYENCMKKIIIICKKHGKFEQTPLNHLNGHICKSCSVEKVSEGQRKYNEFIKKSNLRYSNKYDYSKVVYINRKNRVVIICPIHGEFASSPMNHLSRSGCTKCSKQEIRDNNKFKFIERSKIVHNLKYDYSEVCYNSDKIKLSIICDKHGKFNQQPNVHLNGVGCPSCSSSKGEKKIYYFLKEKSISFIQEHKFDDCSNINRLPFDFYLPDYNICIEYDGKQHFESNKFFGGDENLKNTQMRDSIKNRYCEKNNIRLIRISYIDFKQIEKILINELWENFKKESI